MKKNSNNKSAKNKGTNFPGVIYERHKDPDGNISYKFLNKEIYNLLCINEKDEIPISDKGHLSAIHWADQDSLLKKINQSEIDMQPFVEEFRIIDNHGYIHWLKGNVFPQKLHDNSYIWSGFLIDETVKKKTEQKLNIVLEHSNDAIIHINSEGKIFESNKAIETIFEYTEKDLLGKNIVEIIAPEDKEELQNYIKNYLNDKNDTNDSIQTFEFLGLKSNKNAIPIEFSISALKEQGELNFIILIKNIQERKAAEIKLQYTKEKLNTVVSSLPCVFFTIIARSEKEYEPTYLSDGCVDIFGFSPKTFFENIEKLGPMVFDKDIIDPYIHKLFTTKTPITLDEESFNLCKQNHWIEIKIKPIFLPDGTIECNGVVIDISEKKEASERLQYLAYNNSITETPNRFFLRKKMTSMIKHAERHNEKIALLSIFPNNLASFYYSYGHDTGDLLLKAAATRIKECIGFENFLAYVSGNLFAVAIPNAVDKIKTMKVVDKIIEGFSKPLTVNEQDFDISLNIGISIFPEDGKDAISLMSKSNAALKKAQQEYKNHLFFTDDIIKATVEAADLRSKLRKAIENGDIKAYFQPQIEIETGKIIGTEALARWVDGDKFISPGIFIPVAEEYGLIDLIGETILEQACFYNQKWQKEGLLSVPVAVNISPRQFNNPKSLLAVIERTLEKTKMPPHLLEIEITETSTMINPTESERVIKILQNKGITCSVDDFGTGYSSLSVLKRFSLNKLKIDRSFVTDINKDDCDASIVSATIAMAKALNLKVLAEGVETSDIYSILGDIGCTSIQGFLFSQALPPKEMKEFIINWDPDKAKGKTKK